MIKRQIQMVHSLVFIEKLKRQDIFHNLVQFREIKQNRKVTETIDLTTINSMDEEYILNTNIENKQKSDNDLCIQFHT